MLFLLTVCRRCLELSRSFRIARYLGGMGGGTKSRQCEVQDNPPFPWVLTPSVVLLTVWLSLAGSDLNRVMWLYVSAFRLDACQDKAKRLRLSSNILCTPGT